jgi:hypothetical protein
MTSNGPVEEWGKLLSDVPAASAIRDSITPKSSRLPDAATDSRTVPTNALAQAQILPAASTAKISDMI